MHLNGLIRPYRLTFRESIIALADAQLVTGFALFISGYYSLKCGLSVYHWQIIVWLAWFSCLTHLAAMTSLRTYLYVHRTERSVRLFLTTALLGLLIVSILPTGHFELTSPEDYNKMKPLDLGAHVVPGTDSHYDDMFPQVLTSSPAACFMKTDGIDRRRYSFTSMLVLQAMLINAFIVRFGRLFRSTSAGLKSFIVEAIDRWHGHALDLWKRKLLSMSPNIGPIVAAICVPMQTGVYFYARMFLDAYSSMLLEVCQDDYYRGM
jgi:hypothetical protein